MLSSFKSIWHLLLYPEQQTISRYLLKLIADRINLIIVLALLNYLPYNISGSFCYFQTVRNLSISVVSLDCCAKIEYTANIFPAGITWPNIPRELKLFNPFTVCDVRWQWKDEVKLIFNIIIEIH